MEIDSALSITAVAAAFLIATGANGQWINGKGLNVWGSAKVLLVNNASSLRASIPSIKDRLASN